MSRKSHSSSSKPNNSIGNEDGWTDTTTKQLLSKMKQIIPKPDVSKYKTQLERLEWDKIKVANFSTEECKKQWLRVYKKLRKYKTLSDLVADSLDYVENPYKGNIKKHPDHPKRPLTPYFRFFLSEREKYAAAHKEMTNLQITNILSKKYKQISASEKTKYMEEWKQEMVEYRHKLEEFKRDHPEYYDKNPPRISRTPLQIFNQANASNLSPTTSKRHSSKEIDETVKKSYHDLDDDEKLPYILKAIDEQEKYKEELEMYKKSHPDFIPTSSHTKSTLTLSDWRIHDKSLGKPDRPPANGYNLFCTRMMLSDEMKHLSSRDRIMQCGHKWKYLTDQQKQKYQEEFLTMRDQYRESMKSFLKGLPQRQREEYLERKKEADAKKSSKRKSAVKDEPVDVDESSDAEGDDSNSDSSSSESSSDEDEDEEEEDEEVANGETKESSAKKPNRPMRPTTPISALFLYQKAHREKYTQKHPEASKSDITLMLARKFNNLPQERRAKYLQKENEQRALYNEQLRKQMMAEQDQARSLSPPELKPVTGEQIFQERNKANFMKKADGNHDQAQTLMRKAWTSMNKEKKKKYINIAHERNAKNIAEHKAAKAAADENKKNQVAVPPPPPPERHLSQKEIKSYLALEPKKPPKDAATLFKTEMKRKLGHLTVSARNQELTRLWSELITSQRNGYKKRANASMEEYNKKLQRWIKSLPSQALRAYNSQVSTAKKANGTKDGAIGSSSKGSGLKRKAPIKSTSNAKKAKKEESEESSDSSDNDSSSSSDSDDDSSSSSDDSSNDGSNSSDDEGNAKSQNKNDDSSDDSSSSSDDSDSSS